MTWASLEATCVTLCLKKMAVTVRLEHFNCFTIANVLHGGGAIIPNTHHSFPIWAPALFILLAVCMLTYWIANALLSAKSFKPKHSCWHYSCATKVCHPVPRATGSVIILKAKVQTAALKKKKKAFRLCSYE